MYSKNTGEAQNLAAFVRNLGTMSVSKRTHMVRPPASTAAVICVLNPNAINLVEQTKDKTYGMGAMLYATVSTPKVISLPKVTFLPESLFGLSKLASPGSFPPQS